MDYFLYFLIGALISVLSSFFGVGGGFILKLLHLNVIGIIVLMTFALIFLMLLVIRLRKRKEKGLDKSGQVV